MPRAWRARGRTRSATCLCSVGALFTPSTGPSRAGNRSLVRGYTVRAGAGVRPPALRDVFVSRTACLPVGVAVVLAAQSARGDRDGRRHASQRLAVELDPETGPSRRQEVPVSPLDLDREEVIQG